MIKLCGCSEWWSGVVWNEAEWNDLWWSGVVWSGMWWSAVEESGIRAFVEWSKWSEMMQMNVFP